MSEVPYRDVRLGAGLHAPTISLGMVGSLDGASSMEGRSGGLGGPGDRLVLQRLRDAADAILVGAGTLRTERYGPAVPDEQRRAARSQAGLPEAPRLVVVSRSGDLGQQDRWLSDPAQRPVLITTEMGAAAAATLGDGLDVEVVGEREVGAGAVLDVLRRYGLDRVLCEGGPALAGTLAAADALDELFLTIAPVTLGGPAHRILATDLEQPRRWRLVGSVAVGDEVFLRYLRERDAARD